jgi:PAS domain S-box-containing protein
MQGAKIVRKGDVTFARGADQSIVASVTKPKLAGPGRACDRGFPDAVIDSATDAIVTTTPEGVITSWNPAAERLYGFRRDEAVGHHVGEVVLVAEQAENERALRERVVAGERVSAYETEQRCRGGRTISASVSISAIRSTGGDMMGLCFITRDVSARRQRQHQFMEDMQRYTWLQRIRVALDRDQFSLHVQPISDLKKGEIARQEALLRMHDDTGQELVPAKEFLPAAERFDLMPEIDRWVLENLPKLETEGRALEVNVSGHALSDRRITELIQDAARSGAAEGGRLTVEVPEEVASGDVRGAREFGDRLAALGCDFALDDFGTGYGSFAHLRELPVQYVKIDPRLVHAVARGKSGREIVRTLVEAAHGFGVKTIAESVEDEAAARALRRLGVDFGQGHFFGEPKPAAVRQ